MKYRWYYIEVFRDAKERFEKQKTAGAEIPQQSLLEGAFEYLDQRHSLGEEEQYDQDQTWRHRMESGCGDSDLCTDLYWVLTFCSMMSDLGVYLEKQEAWCSGRTAFVICLCFCVLASIVFLCCPETCLNKVKENG